MKNKSKKILELTIKMITLLEVERDILKRKFKLEEEVEKLKNENID